MKVVKVTAKGQVTIPKPLRERLGIKAGTVLEFREENGCLLVTKVVSADPVSSVYGALRGVGTTDELLDDLRGEAEIP